MKKYFHSTFIALLTLAFLIAIPSFAFAEEQEEMPQYKDVKLTEEQLKELKVLYEDVINKRKGIINKYVEFGVLTKEDGEQMKKHLDKFFEKMEKDGYIPKWDKKHHHKHKGE
ncbi:YckD family protein [Aquibacillus albus]|uniref:Argininosuccinate lyase n=1 Tax=Aquibacillus albus TaxID=1168171 RepID=A0ABS2MXS4_9BACI|nr:YckD family protein [Aquibacillus albus]MBM7570692.1 argininosuccinate lyase [Aquibacillus albus]